MKENVDELTRLFNEGKHALRKMRNRIRRRGDFWYSKEYIYKQRQIGKREAKEE